MEIACSERPMGLLVVYARNCSPRKPTCPDFSDIACRQLRSLPEPASWVSGSTAHFPCGSSRLLPCMLRKWFRSRGVNVQMSYSSARAPCSTARARAHPGMTATPPLHLAQVCKVQFATRAGPVGLSQGAHEHACLQFTCGNVEDRRKSMFALLGLLGACQDSTENAASVPGPYSCARHYPSRPRESVQAMLP